MQRTHHNPEKNGEGEEDTDAAKVDQGRDGGGGGGFLGGGGGVVVGGG